MSNFTDSNQENGSFEQVFAKGGETGTLMRSVDWAQTLLGPIEGWPQSLRTTVSIVLASKFPMIVFWGTEKIQIYNDAFITILGGKHPDAMGLPASITWAEIWDQISVLLETVRTTGEAIYAEDLSFLLLRRGFIEEAYFTFSYSPIRDESANVAGILATVAETTGNVISKRRLGTLRDLSERNSQSRTVKDACRIAAETMSANPADIPFALLYFISEDRRSAHLIDSTGVQPNTLAAPLLIDLADSNEAAWPLGDVFENGHTTLVENLSARFEIPPQGPWPEPPRNALVLPIISSGYDELTGFFVAGVSSRQVLDDTYRSFFDLVAGHIATAVANAQAYEAEQKRIEALAELDRAKTTFFNNVSHEFRTPLTLMLSPLDELLNNNTNPLNSTQSETLQLIQRNGLRLLKLVNTLLDFARIESDRIEISYQPIDLSAFTADLASMFRSTVEKAGLKLIIDCPPLPEPIYVDREMWEKVVLNLLSNAFKFTLRGEITVRMVAFADHVELQVGDTGIGIPEEELPNLFHRFYRVRNTQARTYEGSGIGLALVQDLVSLHSGEVTVSSEPGVGSTFVVSLPRGSKHLPQDRIQNTRTLASTGRGTSPYVEEAKRWLPDENDEAGELQALASIEDIGFKNSASVISYSRTRNLRIVVVEDNADMREYLARLLRPYWHVETYSDGQAALLHIQKQRPDLVLSDVMMPGLDGFGLLQALRNDLLMNDLPVILLSARAGEEATIEGLEAGADDYLVKPFTARELLARINAQLEMSQLRQRILETEQVARSEAELERERVSNLLNSMSDAFLVVDRDFRFTYLNPKAQELYFGLTGETVEAFIGSIMWDKFPGAEESVFGQTYKRALQEQIPLSVEALFAPVNTWFEVRLYPNSDGLSIYFRDITQRKQAEKALEQYARDLKRSNQDLERFAYIASHDLQGPLRTVTSYLQLLENRYKDLFDQDGRDFINFAITGAAQMRELIMDLLAYSRVKTDERNFVSFSAEKALKIALQNLQLEIEESQAKIIYEELPTITGNETQFVQLFQNFVSNAIKFHGEALPEIRVSAQLNESEWLFAVKDNGIGIGQEYLERIFIMFQRLHTREAYPGTGIGLAICKKVVEHHHGQLWAESKPGEGTTFYFTIPIDQR